MVPSFCDKNNCCSGFFPSTVKYFTETYCDSTKCVWVIGVEASSERAVSDSWAIKLLAGMVLSLTVQALLKEKNKALCNGATYATQWAFQASGVFFLFSLRAKVRAPFAWFLQIPPPPTEVGPIPCETSTERPAPRPVLPAGPSHCGVEIHCPVWDDGLWVRWSSVTSILWSFQVTRMETFWCRGSFEKEQVGIMPCACWLLVVLAVALL